MPFYKTCSTAESRTDAAKKKMEWEDRQAKHAQWESEKAAREAKQAEWEAKHADWERRQARLQQQATSPAAEKDWDVESTGTNASTAPTATPVTLDPEEVERMVMLDKNVRKFVKLLRDISQLEGRKNLDALQKLKLERKADVEMELEAAKGLARVRAEYELRAQLAQEA